MAIATSGKAYKWGASKMLVTCVGGTSLVEINRDDTGYVPLTGGEIIQGIIPNNATFTADLKTCFIRFTDQTGTPVISFG